MNCCIPTYRRDFAGYEPLNPQPSFLEKFKNIFIFSGESTTDPLFFQKIQERAASLLSSDQPRLIIPTFSGTFFIYKEKARREPEITPSYLSLFKPQMEQEVHTPPKTSPLYDSLTNPYASKFKISEIKKCFQTCLDSLIKAKDKHDIRVIFQNFIEKTLLSFISTFNENSLLHHLHVLQKGPFLHTTGLLSSLQKILERPQSDQAPFLTFLTENGMKREEIPKILLNLLFFKESPLFKHWSSLLYALSCDPTAQEIFYTKLLQGSFQNELPPHLKDLQTAIVASFHNLPLLSTLQEEECFTIPDELKPIRGLFLAEYPTSFFPPSKQSFDLDLRDSILDTLISSFVLFMLEKTCFHNGKQEYLNRESPLVSITKRAWNVR